MARAAELLETIAENIAANMAADRLLDEQQRAPGRNPA
jgi:hypothetical protein